jgi:hypothetical protein
MKHATTLLTTLLLLFVTSDVSAQRTRRGRSSRPAAPKSASTPQPTPTPVPDETPAAPKPPVLLAIVNGQNITTADIDPRARQEADALDGRIAEARKQTLELEINSRLLDIEAKKRKTTAQELYNAEVLKKIAEPTAAEITKFAEENRNQLNESDPAEVQKMVGAYL